MKTVEIHKLGLSTQREVVPGLLSLVRESENGTVPAKDIKRASLSTSGLRYDAARKILRFTCGDGWELESARPQVLQLLKARR